MIQSTAWRSAARLERDRMLQAAVAARAAQADAKEWKAWVKEMCRGD
ncbi:hypothetical protein [Thermomonas alba]|nr:hypothetical protein [Thermomonas alba]